MNKPEKWTFDEFISSGLKNAVIWVIESVKSKVKERINYPNVQKDGVPPVGIEKIVVIGGGTLIDKAKYWRAENSPNSKLIAVPSIWGSGAENSPVVVLNNGDGGKIIFKGNEYLPDIRVVWDELIKDIAPSLALYACGDVWAHALEGLFSPIANDEIREETSNIINSILYLPLSCAGDWFEYSARACAAQAAASVGVIHGIAHVIEETLKLKLDDPFIGHARICSTYLWPVLSLMMKQTDKIDKLFSNYKIDKSLVIKEIKLLYDEEFYFKTMPVLEYRWQEVLKNPLTRINSFIIRQDYINYFKRGAFE